MTFKPTFIENECRVDVQFGEVQTVTQLIGGEIYDGIYEVVVPEGFVNIILCKILTSCVGINVCSFENFVGSNSSDSVDISKTYFYAFFIW